MQVFQYKNLAVLYGACTYCSSLSVVLFASESEKGSNFSKYLSTLLKALLATTLNKKTARRHFTFTIFSTSSSLENFLIGPVPDSFDEQLEPLGEFSVLTD